MVMELGGKEGEEVREEGETYAHWMHTTATCFLSLNTTLQSGLCEGGGEQRKGEKRGGRREGEERGGRREDREGERRGRREGEERGRGERERREGEERRVRQQNVEPSGRPTLRQVFYSRHAVKLMDCTHLINAGGFQLPTDTPPMTTNNTHGYPLSSLLPFTRNGLLNEAWE